MPHVFEPAASGRSKCRGCGQALPKGELRFGERLPNPFAEGEVTHWFHPKCAAYKRPDAFLEAIEGVIGLAEADALRSDASAGIAAPRLPRIDGAERAPSGQAKCRHCRESIARDEWRIRLAFHEEGTFSPGGFVHVGCRVAYFDTDALLERVLHFSATLAEADREALRQALAAPVAPLPPR